MDVISRFQNQSWGIAEFWVDEYEKAHAESQKAREDIVKAERDFSDPLQVCNFTYKLSTFVKEKQITKL